MSTKVAPKLYEYKSGAKTLAMFWISSDAAGKNPFLLERTYMKAIRP